MNKFIISFFLLLLLALPFGLGGISQFDIFNSLRIYGFVTLLFLIALYFFIKKDVFYSKLEKNSNKIAMFIIAYFTALFLKASISGFYSFNVNALDFTIFDNMLTGTKQFMFSSICKCNHLSVHSSYIMYLLVPFRKIFDHTVILSVLHALILASSGIPLYLILKQNIKSNIMKFGFLISFYLFGSVGQILNYNFHFEVIYIPLVLWLFYFLHKKNYIFSSIFAVLVLSIKEDAAIYLAALYLGYLIFNKEISKKHSLMMFIVSCMYFALNLKILMPYFAADRGFVIAGTASKYGNEIPSILHNMLQSYKTVFLDIFMGKTVPLFLSFLFLPLISLELVFVFAAIAVIYSSSSAPMMASYSLYYSAPLVPFLFFGLIKANTRFSKKGLIYYTTFIALVLIAFASKGKVEFYKINWNDLKDTESAILNIKENTQICAQGIYPPRINKNVELSILSKECVDKNLDTYIISKELSAYPSVSKEVEALFVELERKSNYRKLSYGKTTIFEKQ